MLSMYKRQKGVFNIELKMNVELSERQAKEYMQIAEDLIAEHSRLESIIANVRGAWRGNASSMYASKLDAYRAQLGNDAAKIRNDAIEFRNKIEEIKAMDQQIAAEMAAAAGGGAAP